MARVYNPITAEQGTDLLHLYLSMCLRRAA